MELTYALFYDLLRQHLVITEPEETLMEKEVREVLPWTGRAGDCSTLYLALESADLGMKNILYLRQRPGQGWSVITERPMESASLIYQTVQRFQQWKTQCLLLGDAEHDLPALLLQGTKILGFRIILFDREYHTVGQDTSWGLIDNHSAAQMDPQDLAGLYDDDPDFDSTFQKRGFQRYDPTSIPGYQLYYRNLFYQNYYLGRVLVAIPLGSEGRGSLQLAREYCEVVERCYQYLYRHQNPGQSSKELLEMCKHLLRKEPYSHERLDVLIREKGWDPSQQYRVLCLHPNGYFHSEQTIKFYATQFEYEFPSCIALQIESDMYCLQNLDIEMDENFQQKLAVFLRENLFCGGISLPYRDFFDSYRYRLQAEDAIRYGQIKDPSLWRYHFADYVADYTLAQCLRQYPARDLCPKNLRKILEYDQGHPDSCLAQTLYHYYTCQFNAQIAAQKLFIHRTTFFYRLRKIQSIAPIHPDDPEETCQMLLAFAALKASGGVQF